MSVTEDPEAQAAQAASLADAVLQAEADRQAAQEEKEVLFADDLLPGVGGEEMTLREGLRTGGAFTFLMLLLLNSAEQLENATLGVLAPDIRDSFGVSDGVIVFISAAAGGFLVLGALPMGWLADRYRRSPIVAGSAAVFSLMVFLSGLTVNAFTLFLSRFGVGIAKSATIPVHGSLIADTYPIGVRGRLSATTMGTGLLIGAISPALVGGIAELAGGEDGWRWAFFVLSVPAIVLAVLALRIPEPPRGQYEMKDVLGEVIDTRAVSISVEAAFSRLRQVRTLRTVMAAFAALGFGLFTGPVLQGLYVEDRFGLDALERGLLGSLGGLFVVAILPFAARGYDARFREDPSRALRLVGLLLLPVAVLVPVQYSMPNALAFAIVGVAPTILMMTAFTMVGPVLQSVVPYRLRGLGAALGSIYIFFIGATGGALLAAFFADAIGPRAAVIILMVPSTLIGGSLIVRSSMFIKNDLSLVVAELREEMDEFQRQQADPEDIPVLHVNNVDFAYGHVQVLFDVGFEVRRGEVLALLGTNGAGKSTILRVIAGLGTPARGVVRLNGRTVTYVSPERRGRLGIRLLPGGKGVFPQMSVRENLEVAGFVYRGEADDLERRIAKVLDLFDDLADRQDQLAGSLSGGQQQMLALGCTLLHEPEVLLIDELSLGLSPIMVQQLLGVVERLKGEGTTIVIVEQSLNVALAMADRAVFLEKGQVRFEGQARELLERDDLARAVFLGREGGSAGLATLFTRQLIFDGVISGMVFGLVAMGIVLVYRSTRVINFAVANLGIIGAGLFALLVAQYGVPFWLAAVLGLGAGILYGSVVELVVIRRLFTAPRVIVLVATIGIAQLSLAILLAFPEIDAPGARFPVPVGGVWEVADVRIVGPQLTIFLVVPLVAIGLGWLLNRTAVGKAVKASADNPDLARLAGISPKVVSTLVWAIAGGLATLSIALLAGQSGSAQNLDNLGPSTLVRALAAAVIAGMASFPRAFFAGIAIGVVQALISFNFLDQPGLMDFLVFLAVLVAVNWQSRRGVGETQTFSFTAKARPIPERLRDVWWIRQLDKAGLVLLGVVALALPLVIEAPSRHLLYTSILGFAICALSLTVLTGWAGQLSLGQMAFAGIGAFLTATFSRGLNLDVGWHETRFLHAGIEPLRFGPAVVFSVLVVAGLAALIGAGALRVRGLYLAVVTFAFGLAAQQYLYDRPILSGGFADSVPLPRTDAFGIDVSSQRSYYYVVLAVLVVAVVIVSRLRTTGIGRGTIAVRDNPDAAAAYTVSTTATRLRAFALAGGLAALGGALLAGNIQAVPSDRLFTVEDSLLLVAIVVIGGLGSVAGTVLGAVWVIGLPAFFPENELVPLLTSSVGLLVLLLYFPGGLVQIGYATRTMIIEWAEKRLGPAPEKRVHVVPQRTKVEREPLPAGTPALRASDVVVRFGGINAVDGASIEVGDGEVVGLIGTNGAGKSTLMNAVGGLVPYAGDVEILGERAGRNAAARSRQGLGRSFQAATLFPELTVRETVLVAFEARRRTGFLSSALFLPPAIKAERQRRREGDELIDFLGLGRYADSYISDLSTGTRRIVELAGLLALDARVLCLDEPTAGVAQRETEAFGPLVLELRRELGASMLVIEHDMPLILSISDRVYCLELGTVIAEGPPSAVRNDPAVVASYLGTDERAIARSGALAADPVVEATS